MFLLALQIDAACTTLNGHSAGKVQCCARNDQQYAQICTAALFSIPAATCFSNSLSSSGSVWICLSYMNIHIDLVVYHIMLVKWPVYWSVVVPSVVLRS
jgi:hypothetical protein